MAQEHRSKRKTYKGDGIKLSREAKQDAKARREEKRRKEKRREEKRKEEKKRCSDGRPLFPFVGSSVLPMRTERVRCLALFLEDVHTVHGTDPCATLDVAPHPYDDNICRWHSAALASVQSS